MYECMGVWYIQYESVRGVYECMGVWYVQYE